MENTPGPGALLPGPGGTTQNTQSNNAQNRGNEQPVELTEDEKADLQKLIDLIRSRNPYQLSRDGILNLPGFAGIPLGGLTEEQATLRLQIEPVFHKLQVRLTRLPLKKYGVEALKPFGYDLLRRVPANEAYSVPNRSTGDERSRARRLCDWRR